MSIQFVCNQGNHSAFKTSFRRVVHEHYEDACNCNNIITMIVW